MSSKIHSGVSWEAKLKRRRFLMPRGRLTDLFWGAMWESKIVPNPFQSRFTHMISKSILEWFWNPLETDFDNVFKVSA